MGDQQDRPSMIDIFDEYAFQENGQPRNHVVIGSETARKMLPAEVYSRLSEPGQAGYDVAAIREGFVAAAVEHGRATGLDTRVTTVAIKSAVWVVETIARRHLGELRPTTPPKAGWWILALTIPRDQLDFVEGDLAESYARYVDERGRPAALWWYWLQIIGSFFHFGLRLVKNLLPLADVIKAFKGG